MNEVYSRNSLRDGVDTLVVVQEHVSFHSLARFVVHSGAIHSSRYFLLDRSRRDAYTHWEHVVFNLMMRLMTRRDHGDVWKAEYSCFWPTREETNCPSVVPVTLETWSTWNEADFRRVSILSSGDGWDFYDTEWLLHKWESALGLFDDDILCLCIPVYPKDLYNQRVPPDIVFREVDRFVERFGEEGLKKKFFALYCLCRDDFGKILFSFFYHHECGEYEAPGQVLDALYSIYVTLPSDHYYRPYLFEKNYSVLDIHRKLTFKAYMLIHQFLSYHGMYVSRDFYMLYRKEIVTGFSTHRKELHMVSSIPEHWEEKQVGPFLDAQLSLLYERLGDHVHWIGKWHLETWMQDSYCVLWRALCPVWDFIPRRNIYLWEESSFRYSEYQLRIGHEFRLVFDSKTLRSMTASQQNRFDQLFGKQKIKKNYLKK